MDNVAAAGAALGWHVPEIALRVLLPAGISFYTFQSMSYTIDVYRGHAPARRNFIDVAAFVSFFPHLVAGPIMRATNLLPQFEQPRHFSPAAARDATVLIVWGFFKKLVIADNVGVIANKVFALESPDFFVLWAGVFAFAIQIYADFSAYTDIARGVAKWYGFDLIRNFEHPYLATGPADFWRRWNISLSTWFRDYLYIPLGGSRRGPGADGRQYPDHVPGVGLLARRELELRVVGRLSRRAADRRSCGRHPCPRHGAARSGLDAPTADRRHVRVDDDRLVDLPRDGARSSVARSAADSRDLNRAWPFDGYLPVPPRGACIRCRFGSRTSGPRPAVPTWPRPSTAPEAAVHWPRVALQALVCGLMLAAVLTLRSSTALNFIYFSF